jgi:hypothetical protein
MNWNALQVKEGPLRKVCNGGPRKYKFVLFNDMLLYGTETLRGMLLDKTKKYKAHKKIPLEAVSAYLTKHTILQCTAHSMVCYARTR